MHFYPPTFTLTGDSTLSFRCVRPLIIDELQYTSRLFKIWHRVQSIQQVFWRRIDYGCEWPASYPAMTTESMPLVGPGCSVMLSALWSSRVVASRHDEAEVTVVRWPDCRCWRTNEDNESSWRCMERQTTLVTDSSTVASIYLFIYNYLFITTSYTK